MKYTWLALTLFVRGFSFLNSIMIISLSQQFISLLQRRFLHNAFIAVAAIVYLTCLPIFAQHTSFKEKPFDTRLSIIGGINPFFTSANAGIRLGIQFSDGIYFGGVVSINPYRYNTLAGEELSGGNPIILCGETGYEFQLHPIMFLRPYLGLGLYGISGTYQEFGRARRSPPFTNEILVTTFGAVYSIEVATNLLVGIEARLVFQAGFYGNIHVGYRL